MRISTHMLQQGALRGLGRTLESLAQAQTEVTTGRRVNTMSDDPVDASQIMRMNGALRDIDQYKRNADAATTRLSAEDVVLTTARDLVQQARDVASSAGGAAIGSPERTAAIAQLQQIHDQLVSLGNTRVGDEYIFGGDQTTNPPFQSDGTYVGDSTVRQAAVDSQITVNTNHTGDQLFAPVFATLATLTTDLQSGTQAQVNQTASALTTQGQQLLTLQTQVGSRIADIQTTTTSLAARANDITGRVEAIRDADPAQSLVKVMSAQQALERAYAVIGKVLSSNILNEIP